jgi:hypothetical protein
MPTDSALIARERVMPDWLKFGFLAIVIFVICWGCAIAYWRMTGGNPAAGDLILYLVGAPASLLLLFFVGRKLTTRHVATPASVALPITAKAVVTPPQALSLAILAASLRLPHGASPEELASAIADNKARADLDKELTDDDGFPIMTARSSEAVDEALQEEITEWLALDGMAELHFSDEQWRALTLANAVVAELAAQAVGQVLHQVGTQTRLQLLPILPTEWDIAHRRAASMWLKQMVAQYGWPVDRIMLNAEEIGSPVDVSPAAVFNRLAHNGATTDAPFVAMVVAGASNIGDATIAQWAAKGSLFTSSQPHGRIPGEGAAGLLISNQAGLADGATIALLDGIEEAHRDSSADEAKRTDPKLLGELSERALKRSGMSAANVAMLIADTGPRVSRALELMAHVSAGLPQLDETDDVVRVGVACGTCDAVPLITALALGRHYVLEREAPVLCVSNEDPYRRVVALIRPSAPSSR